MADAGVTSVVAKLGELAAAEATALLRVDAEIRVLRRKLAYLQALVRGADRQRRGRASELLLLWLRETREVAFEVEDAVDEFHLRVEAFHLCRRRGNWWGWGRDAVSLVQGLVTQVKIEFRQLNPNCSSPTIPKCESVFTLTSAVVWVHKSVPIDSYLLLLACCSIAQLVFFANQYVQNFKQLVTMLGKRACDVRMSLFGCLFESQAFAGLLWFGESCDS
jgi:hypothetical protein